MFGLKLKKYQYFLQQQVSEKWAGLLLILYRKCIGNNPFIHNYHSMAMVRIMDTSVGKISSYERSQRLYKKLYHTVLTCQITLLQSMCVLDAMYASRRGSFHTDHMIQTISKMQYIYSYMTSYETLYFRINFCFLSV